MFRLLLSIGLIIAPVAGHAHEVTDLGHGLLTGFLHPLMGLDHVLAMVAVGIWGAQLSRPAIWVLPVTFPMVMAFGGILGLVAMPFPGVEVGIALSAVVLGALVLLQVKVALSVAMVVVGVFALCHGYAHGAEIPAATSPASFALGFVIGTGLLHSAGIAMGLMNTLRYGSEALRVAGGVIASGGVYYLTLQVI